MARDVLVARTVSILAQLHTLLNTPEEEEEERDDEDDRCLSRDDEVTTGEPEKRPRADTKVWLPSLYALHAALKGLEAFDFMTFYWKYGYRIPVPSYVVLDGEPIAYLSWLIGSLRLCLELDNEEVTGLVSMCLIRVLHPSFAQGSDKMLVTLVSFYMLPRLLVAKMDVMVRRLKKNEEYVIEGQSTLRILLLLIGVCRSVLQLTLVQMQREYDSYIDTGRTPKSPTRREASMSPKKFRRRSSTAQTYLPASDAQRPLLRWKAALDIPATMCVLTGMRCVADQFFQLTCVPVPQHSETPEFPRRPTEHSSRQPSFNRTLTDTFLCDHGRAMGGIEVTHTVTHSYLCGWALLVVSISNFYRAVTDVTHTPLPEYEPRMVKPLGKIDPALALMVIATNNYSCLKEVIGILTQASSHVLCRWEHQLLKQIRTHVGETVRKMMSLLYTLDAAGWTDHTSIGGEYTNMWQAQMDSFTAFLFRQDSLTRLRRVTAMVGEGHEIIPPITTETLLYHLDWKQGARVLLEIARSPVFMVSSLNSTIAGYQRLADAIRCAGSDLTVLQLNRLTLALISLAFGYNGAPLDRETLLIGVSKQLLGGMSQLKPRDLPLGQILGLQTCYAMHKAGVHVALRYEAVDSSLRTTLQVPRVGGFEALMEIAQIAHRLIEQNLRSKIWTKRVTWGLDQLASEYVKYQKLRHRIPKLHSLVNKTVEEWLLLLRDGSNIQAPTRTCVTDQDNIQTAVPVNEVLDMCIKCEVQSAINLIEEGASLYAAIWNLPIPSISQVLHGVPRPPPPQYAINTIGYYLFSFCDPTLMPATFRRQVNRGKGYFLNRGLAFSHSRDGIPIHGMDTNENVRSSNMRFLLWTATHWPDFSHLSLAVTTPDDKDKVSTPSTGWKRDASCVGDAVSSHALTDRPTVSGSVNATLDRFLNGSLASKKGIQMPGYLYSESTSDSKDEEDTSAEPLQQGGVKPQQQQQQQTVSQLYAQRPLTSSRRKARPYPPGDLASHTTSLSQHTAEPHTDTVVTRRQGELKKSDDTKNWHVGANLTTEAALAVWLTICARESKSAFPFLILREEALWAGRTHPILAQISNEISQLHFESRVTKSDNQEDHFEKASLDLLETMLEKTGVVKRAWDLRTSTYSWLKDNRGEADWNWLVILQITTQVLTAAFKTYRKSPALSLFFEELYRAYQKMLEDVSRKPSMASPLDASGLIREFVCPNLSEAYLLKSALRNLSDPNSEDVIDQTCWQCTNFTLDLLIRGLSSAVQAPHIEPEWFMRHGFVLQSLCNSTEVAKWVPDKHKKFFDLMIKYAERVDEFTPALVERMTSVLMPQRWKPHWEIHSRLLNAKSPLRVLHVLSCMGLPLHDNQTNLRPPEGFRNSVKGFLKSFMEALLKVRLRFPLNEERTEHRWRRVVGSDTVLTILRSVLDDLVIEVGSQCDGLPNYLLTLNPLNGDIYDFRTMWNDPTVLSPSMRLLLLDKADIFPHEDVFETLDEWLRSFKTPSLPLSAPAILFGETFSTFAKLAVDRLSLRGSENLMNYQLIVLQANYQMLRPKRATLKAIISSTPALTRSSSMNRSQGGLLPKKSSSRMKKKRSSYHIKLKVKRLKTVSPSLCGLRIEDLWDVSLNQLPLRLLVRVGDNDPLELAIILRSLKFSPLMVLDLVKSLPVRHLGTSHIFWPLCLYLEHWFGLAGLPNPRERAIVWAYLRPWLASLAPQDHSTSTVPYTREPMTSCRSQWWHATGILQVPIFDIHELEPETHISVAVSLDPVCYLPGTSLSPGTAPRLYVNNVGNITLTPSWQTISVETLLQHKAIQPEYQIAIPDCACNVLLSSNLDPDGHPHVHIVGFNFHIHVFTLASVEERNWLRKARFPRDSKSSLQWPPKEVAAGLAHLEDVGVGDRRENIEQKPHPNTKDFNWSPACSFINRLAATEVGKSFVTQQLKRVHGSRKSLLRNPAVLTRLLGLGVELNGHYDAFSGLLTIMGQHFGPIPRSKTLEQHLALSVLGDPGLRAPVRRQRPQVNLTDSGRGLSAGQMSELDISFLKVIRERLNIIDVKYYASKEEFESCSSELGDIVPAVPTDLQPLSLISFSITTATNAGVSGITGLSTSSVSNSVMLKGDRRSSIATDALPLTRSMRPNFKHLYHMRRFPVTPWSGTLVVALTSASSDQVAPSSPGSACLIRKCADEMKLCCPALQFDDQHLKVVNLVAQMHNSVIVKTQGLLTQFEAIARERPELLQSVELVWRVHKFSEAHRFSPDLMHYISKLILGTYTKHSTFKTSRAERLVLLTTLEYGWNLTVAYEAHFTNPATSF